jgi:hypothetical protein
MLCPVCKATNDSGPQCRRCRADLGLLFSLEEQRRHILAAASRHLAEGRAMEAQALAQRADELRGDQESRRLLALSALLRCDFAGAWRYYQLIKSV